MTRNGKHTSGAQLLDGLPHTLAHGAEEGATKVAEVVENASVRVARGAGQVARGAGQASGLASELSGQIKGRMAHPPYDIRDAKHSIKDAQLGLREARLGLRGRIMRTLGRSMIKRRAGLLPSGDAMLKAQLVKTSRELAHESSDLGAAVESLNKLIKANRRAAAKGRTRLLGGLALGAALTYHLDAEHGRERRAATARMLTGMVRGQREPRPPLS